MSVSRRSFVRNSAQMAAAVAASAALVRQTGMARAAQEQTLAFTHYEIEVGWDESAFSLFNTYHRDNPVLDMIALHSTGSGHSGSVSFWLGETPWDDIDDVTAYLEEDEKLNFLDGTTIIREYSDSQRDGACLLFLPEWEGEIDTYGYWEVRKIGEADNEWAHIKLDGTLGEFDAVDLQERFDTVTFDGDPVFQLTDLDDLVAILSDLKDQYLG